MDGREWSTTLDGNYGVPISGEREGVSWSRDLDDGDREIRYEEQRNSTTTRWVYTKYVDSGENVLRARVSEITFNSDGTKRVGTTIYVYYGNEAGTFKDYKLRFVVRPEGVKRYLVTNPTESGVDLSGLGDDPEDPEDTAANDGPLQTCDLDRTAVVTDTAAPGRSARTRRTGSTAAGCPERADVEAHFRTPLQGQRGELEVQQLVQQERDSAGEVLLGRGRWSNG